MTFSMAQPQAASIPKVEESKQPDKVVIDVKLNHLQQQLPGASEKPSYSAIEPEEEQKIP